MTLGSEQYLLYSKLKPVIDTLTLEERELVTGLDLFDLKQVLQKLFNVRKQDGEALKALSGIDFGKARGIGKEHACDIDYCYEKGGYFLFAEIKAPSETFKGDGAKRAYKALSKCPQTTVLILRMSGERTSIGAQWFDPTSYQLLLELKTGDVSTVFPSKTVPCTLERFMECHSRWRDAARTNDLEGMANAFPVADEPVRGCRRIPGTFQLESALGLQNESSPIE